MNPFSECETVGPCIAASSATGGMGQKSGAVKPQHRNALMFIARKGWCYWRTRSIVRWHTTVSTMEKRDYAVGGSVGYVQNWAYVLRLRSRR
jgi:hypothetical protein